MVKRRAGEQEGPRLLAGGNPQMAKGDGDVVVQQWIAAMPGWKQDVGRRLDALIVSAVPDVRKAVRWNTPFYGLVGNGWFMAFHCLTKYVKVAIFQGTSLNPVPPVSSKQPNVRYVHLTETEAINWQQIGDWVLQASRLPGDRLF
ncbi:MAG: DUF1801 domain-containing protein [Planctomyces sp.]|jgi:hypothetical protein